MTWTTDNIDIFRDGQKRARLTQSSSDGEPICAALNFCNVTLPEGPDAPTLSDMLCAMEWAAIHLHLSDETVTLKNINNILAAFQPVEEHRSAIGWLSHSDFEGVCVTDPDGWDRQNFDASWDEEITRAEFERRLARSTSIRQPVETVQETETPPTTDEGE